MLINFMGSIISIALLDYSGLTELLSVSDDLSAEELIAFISGHIAGILLYLLYAIFLLAIVIAGIVLFFVNLKNIQLYTTEYSVPAGKRFRTYFVNAGVILFCIYWIVQIIIQLFS
jgi:uncharacterized metal-binding protein